MSESIGFVLGGVASCAILALAGCSPREFPKTYPVKGRIVLPDGTPMPGGHVEFESLAHPDLRAVGSLNQDGSFDSVATYKSSGRETPGLVEGDHRVRIEPPPDDQDNRQAMKQFAGRYKNYDKSGLTVTIPAPDNDVTFKLEPAKK